MSDGLALFDQRDTWTVSSCDYEAEITLDGYGCGYVETAYGNGHNRHSIDVDNLDDYIRLLLEARRIVKRERR